MPIVEYVGLSSVTGPLVIIENVEGVSFDELVEITTHDGETRHGRVVEVGEKAAVVQVFEGTSGLSLQETRTKFTHRPLEIPLSKEIIGRVFSGIGTPIDEGGPIHSDRWYNINGIPINPVSRVYPRNFIQTGVSAIDALTTLIRGQKLPIFSGSGMPHNQLAAQITRQARIQSEKQEDFIVVFAAIGVKHDVADFFRRSFESSGVLQNVVMYLNLADDPPVERIVTPRVALTAAEYLAFEENIHVLVVMTDMTNYAEALREISSQRGEVPGRKGYPSYLYSDLASLYERAGMVEGKTGSITQIPILTMPNDDITHPVPDLTGFITEGQIVLGRDLYQRGVYPPISVLPSLSRLMKDGIGEGFTRKDHPDLSSQLFASYAHVKDVLSLASVIGEDELSDIDKKYLEFGRAFEQHFIGQGKDENRDIGKTLDIGWEMLRYLPPEELDRLTREEINQYYKGENNGQ